ncbi:MAG: type II secretion system secretin GspD [Candidatus Accumulibacter sp.]|uniref:type II secretion system secretin GspD n=1 Tax=Accumulibacter sp. TaxID=2053492 RepID=UPI001AC7E52E|nr:type II secretion system secretin GspD [Accumulibacter sp.]MBN8439822.1 type II secretion system secretin GspD [Accumulibacter sp.]
MNLSGANLRGLLLLAFLTLPGSVLPAQDENTRDAVSLNFVNAEIGAVIQAIGKLSGRNFVVDPRVKGTINIVTPRPVDKTLIYSILLSALRLQGYAVIEGKGVTRVVPEADAKLYATPVGKGKPTTDGDRVQTEVFTLRHESAAQVLPVIRPLVAPNNSVTVYAAKNSLVVTDYAENLQRIARIIESIDVPQSGVRVFALQHASAADVATAVNRLMNDGAAVATGGGAADGSQRVSVQADARSNSLLVWSENLSKIAAVRQLVTALDVPGSAGNIHVIYLRNAEAVKVAQTLRAVLSGEAGSQPMGNPSFAPNSRSTTPSPPGTTAFPDSSSGAASGLPPTTGGGIVQADAMTNSLIITAPEAIYHNIKRVVEQLDKRRAQVYVEALITEIIAEKAAEFGIQWQAGKVGTTSAYGGTNFSTGGGNILNLATGATLPNVGMNLIMGSGSVTVLGKEILNLNVLAYLLESETRANILSTPNLVTLDNEEAKIVVGRNLPFVTGQYTNTGAGTTVTNPFQTIERKDVGLTLKIKPQISEGGTVRLQIYQEASSVVESTAGNLNGPVTNKRSIESTVLVDDGAIIALGGLVEDSYSAGSERVPLLGDIPYLGALFRYDNRKRSKTNLVIFLRPVILRDGATAANLSNERYDYVIGQQSGSDRPDNRWRGEEAPPLLPSPKLRQSMSPMPGADAKPVGQ